MRSYTTQDDRVFNGYGQATWLRVFVTDAGGTDRDLTALYGYDFVSGIDITDDPDNGYATAKLTVSREIFKNAMATEMATSRVNTLGGGTRLLELVARVSVYSQIQPSGVPPTSDAWGLIFDGTIESTDSSADPMTVELADYSSKIADAWIETERSYGVWAPGRNVLANEIVCPSADNPAAPSGYMQAQGAGTTGSTEPTWPASGSTVTDNDVTWKNLGTTPTGTPMEVQIQKLLDDNLGVGVWTLYTPTSPSVVTRAYVQQQDSLLAAIQDVADIAGWDVRYRWSDSYPFGAGFYLTLYNPNRDNVTSGYSIPASRYDPIGKMARDRKAIRNAIAVSYYDIADLDSSGNPKPKTVTVTDTDSISAYGRRYMAVAEAAGGAIGTSAQATAMANAILSDLAQPPIEAQIVMNHAWWFQPTDVLTIEADQIQISSDMLCAVYSIEHSIQQGARATTTLNVRGKPSSGVIKWMSKQAAGGMNGGPTPQATLDPVDPDSSESIRGMNIQFQIPKW